MNNLICRAACQSSKSIRTFQYIRQFHLNLKHNAVFFTTNSYFNFIKKITSNPNLKCLQLRWNSEALSNISTVSIQQSVNPLSIRRPGRKKAPAESLPGQEMLKVVAFSTAEEYNLELLTKTLIKQSLYQITATSEDMHDVLHVSAKYQVGKIPREIYFFREGSVVFWNFQESEIQSVLQTLQTSELNSYNKDVSARENELMEYTYNPNATRLINGSILLNEEGTTDLEKYAFSNALALSVKLAIWESSLDTYVDSIEWVLEAMRKGKGIKMSRHQVLQKTGELFTLRHLINLSSDLLDTPDFYWDRENLETLYNKTCNYLNIARRTKVMNEKLNHCCELIELLSDHLNDKHHLRLEWMIIILIFVEVVFGFIHYIERYLDVGIEDSHVKKVF